MPGEFDLRNLLQGGDPHMMWQTMSTMFGGQGNYMNPNNPTMIPSRASGMRQFYGPTAGMLPMLPMAPTGYGKVLTPPDLSNFGPIPAAMGQLGGGLLAGIFEKPVRSYIESRGFMPMPALRRYDPMGELLQRQRNISRSAYTKQAKAMDRASFNQLMTSTAKAFGADVEGQEFQDMMEWMSDSPIGGFVGGMIQEKLLFGTMAGMSRGVGAASDLGFRYRGIMRPGEFMDPKQRASVTGVMLRTLQEQYMPGGAPNAAALGTMTLTEIGTATAELTRRGLIPSMAAIPMGEAGTRGLTEYYKQKIRGLGTGATETEITTQAQAMVTDAGGEEGRTASLARAQAERVKRKLAELGKGMDVVRELFDPNQTASIPALIAQLDAWTGSALGQVSAAKVRGIAQRTQEISQLVGLAPQQAMAMIQETTMQAQRLGLSPMIGQQIAVDTMSALPQVLGEIGNIPAYWGKPDVSGTLALLKSQQLGAASSIRAKEISGMLSMVNAAGGIEEAVKGMDPAKAARLRQFVDAAEKGEPVEQFSRLELFEMGEGVTGSGYASANFLRRGDQEIISKRKIYDTVRREGYRKSIGDFKDQMTKKFTAQGMDPKQAEALATTISGNRNFYKTTSKGRAKIVKDAIDAANVKDIDRGNMQIAAGQALRDVTPEQFSGNAQMSDRWLYSIGEGLDPMSRSAAVGMYADIAGDIRRSLQGAAPTSKMPILRRAAVLIQNSRLMPGTSIADALITMTGAGIQEKEVMNRLTGYAAQVSLYDKQLLDEKLTGDKRAAVQQKRDITVKVLSDLLGSKETAIDLVTNITKQGAAGQIVKDRLQSSLDAFTDDQKTKFYDFVQTKVMSPASIKAGMTPDAFVKDAMDKGKIGDLLSLYSVAFEGQRAGVYEQMGATAEEYGTLVGRIGDKVRKYADDAAKGDKRLQKDIKKAGGPKSKESASAQERVRERTAELEKEAFITATREEVGIGIDLFEGEGQSYSEVEDIRRALSTGQVTEMAKAAKIKGVGTFAEAEAWVLSKTTRKKQMKQYFETIKTFEGGSPRNLEAAMAGVRGEFATLTGSGVGGVSKRVQDAQGAIPGASKLSDAIESLKESFDSGFAWPKGGFKISGTLTVEGEIPKSGGQLLITDGKGEAK